MQAAACWSAAVPKGEMSCGRVLMQAAALGAARRGEAAARRQEEGVNEAAADAVRGAVGHMLRVLMENLETKSRTYKNKARAAHDPLPAPLPIARLRRPPAAAAVGFA